MNDAHDENLSEAFDHQAARFEKAPVQTDPTALESLVRAADFHPAARLLDAGCGPGLVSEAFLKAGFQVVGVDLSPVMVDRARLRCGFARESARFLQGSVHGPALDELAPFDGAYSRYVLHHVVDPRDFLARQVELIRPGGIVVLCDHLTDPDPALARLHQKLEVARDRTHTRNLTGGEIVDLFAAAGLRDVRYVEEEFTLDFDEWFDRGTPGEAKDDVREAMLRGLDARGFRTVPEAGSSIRLDCVRAIVRGVKR
ncbi:class I SAM-dependent methyltransferase [Paludisphaera soli]|uniref:class I SAM-dependent methyltransferase n=1 Tax=Paludisphaera soli TaxID=2712865 RepID=UPI0013EA2E10|nr:class I SAM-dependent methyltransferase [Paludisphaera soli]